MKSKKTSLKKIKIVGVMLIILGILLCFAGYKNSSIALAGVGCFVLGVILVSDPITWI